MKILIDNGHGSETLGKCSPDKSILEWKWTREIASKVVDVLRSNGVDASLLTPEDNDVPLKERVARVNKQCQIYGSKHVAVVSIHVDASGSDGKWHDPNGWSVRVSENKEHKVSARSSVLSGLLATEALKNGRKLRRPKPNQLYWVQSLAICRDTFCAAVLTENYFMDNQDDCKFLLSEEGKAECVRIHVDGILKYIDVV